MKRTSTILTDSWNNSVLNWDKKKDKGSEKYWGDHWSFPEPLEYLIKKYSNKGIGLEVGCGSARLLIHFHKYFKRLAGVDPSPAGINQSIKRLKELKIKNVDASVSDGFSLNEFDDNSFDLVYSQDVFQHFNNSLVYIYFKEFYRVLKPSGIAIVNFRNILEEFDVFKNVSEKYLKERPHNFGIWVNYITPELIKKISDNVGLDIIEIKKQYKSKDSPFLFVFRKS